MKETSKALAAFVIYRDMGEKRTVEAVAATCHKGVSILNRWSQAHGWVERAKAHDELIAQKAAAADQKARVADAERRLQDRLKVAQALRHKAANALKLMKDEELARKPYAMVQMFDHADKTERLDTGQPTDRTEHGATDDLKELLRSFFAAPVPHESP